ncbi:LysR family transcriptional regulator [Thalassotalea loyana]|uniref:LysR family transcriptional regulator n=1 Tax=Thalassotalea loyana TaxID=280483 RepID=A0ABQ6HBI3_9GAMM|nr:LysR family transcriptional regulator [Thalassotalea loyana]GLX85485.1 LysR family transcriptional regulator [Thalassotalea loyana]
MDLSSRILLFLEVTERGSFAKVAEHRKIDRSVISKQIAKLEEELGVRLLNRTTRSLSITGAGNEVRRKAISLRTTLDETIRLAENYHVEPKGTLKITCSYSLAEQVIQPVINNFSTKFPDVNIELSVSDTLVDIVGDSFDLAFRVGDLKDSTLVARYLARNRLALLATPEFLARMGHPKTISDLQKLPAACYAGQKLKVDYIDYRNKTGEVERIQMNCAYCANDIDMMKSHVLSGASYYLAPAFHIHDEVISGKLVPIMTDLNLLDFAAIYAVYPHRDLPLRTRLFFEAAKEYFGNNPPIWEQNIPGFENMYQ